MPKPGRRGRPREVDFPEGINAVRYVVRSGCGIAHTADPFWSVADRLWLVSRTAARLAATSGGQSGDAATFLPRSNPAILQSRCPLGGVRYHDPLRDDRQRRRPCLPLAYTA